MKGQPIRRVALELLLVLVYVLMVVPARLWCYMRHRDRWLVDSLGYGWVCDACGEPWSFSREDIEQLTRSYGELGRQAAQHFLERQGLSR